MHLMATYLPVLIDWAFKTSEKVPSPFLLMSLYSGAGVKGKKEHTVHFMKL